MSESAQVEIPAAAEAGTTACRTVRRRLVQATLFPPNPPVVVPAGNQVDRNSIKDEDNECKEACGSQKRQRRKRASTGREDRNCSKEEDNECEEACGSQKRQRRSKSVKARPQKKASSVKKEKQTVKRTPKKRKLTSPAKTMNKSPPPNLRLEAKLIAEEHSRIFAGRKIHPFFSSYKAGRKSEEISTVEEGSTLSQTKKRGITLGPIHVFDETQVGNNMLLDWRDWTFCEGVLVGDAYHSDSKSSAFEGNLSHLTFDDLPCLRERSSTNSSALFNEEALSCSISKGCGLDHDTARAYPLPVHGDYVRKLDNDQQSKFLEERMVYYYAASSSFPSETLWTDKFHPKRSTEVCGNDESVNFLSEWLHLWLHRDHQNSKGLNGVKASSFLDDSYQSDNSDSEYTEEVARLKNVLLVTGPVGCGKSAAIYACAKEQGFDVMEVNASECRSGALVKQRFGEALESQWMKWSSADKNKFYPALPHGKQKLSISNEGTTEIRIPDEYRLCDATGADKLITKDSGGAFELEKVKPLILFEDVDITFLEDRGFIAAIQHIAETAKGPLILTTNNENLVLPESLDRLELFFKMPSQLELLSHAYMVCVSEKASVHPHTVERLIEFCKGDIRKTIMQLQFWCQGGGYVKGKKSGRASSSAVLDLDSGHGILPKLIPWSFPSELSELAERETSLALSMIEEHSNFMDIVEGDLDREMLGSQEIDLNEECLEAKKEAMLSRNCSIQNEEFAAPIDVCWDFSRSPGTPVSFSRKSARRNPEIVLSSDSETEAHINQSAGFNGTDPFDCVSNGYCLTPMIDKSSDVKEVRRCFPYLDVEFRNQIDNLSRAEDVSCVPESTYVPETAIDYGNEVSCSTLPTFQIDKMTDYPSPEKAGKVGKSLNRIHKLSDVPGNSCNETAKYCAEEEDTLYDFMHGVASDHVMDECSRIDFKRNFKPINQCDLVPNLVQQSWKRLRVTQSKKDSLIEQKDAIRVLEITSRVTDLISAADLLLYQCNEVIDDSRDPTGVIGEEPELFSWSSYQHQIASTVFEHGFCSFAKDLDGVEENLDQRKKLDLSKEMLSLSSNKMALAKLIQQDMGENQVLEGRTIERTISTHTDTSRSGVMSCSSSLLGVIHSLTPPRMCLSLRGNAFPEYLSSLSKISRLEASRLSESSRSIDNPRRRGRVGAARHYLSTGSLMLSPEDIRLLDHHAYGTPC